MILSGDFWLSNNFLDYFLDALDLITILNALDLKTFKKYFSAQWSLKMLQPEVSPLVSFRIKVISILAHNYEEISCQNEPEDLNKNALS